MNETEIFRIVKATDYADTWFDLKHGRYEKLLNRKVYQPPEPEPASWRYPNLPNIFPDRPDSNLGQ